MKNRLDKIIYLIKLVKFERNQVGQFWWERRVKIKWELYCKRDKFPHQ